MMPSCTGFKFLVLTAGFGLLLNSCARKKTVFREVDASESGISFNNQVTESDSINPLDRTLMYNGGGVAVGDFNGDGLPDLFFTGNQVKNALYLNKGSLKFEDVTDVAGVGGQGNWCGGATVVDINNDGLPDIYVCTSMKMPGSKSHNLLYINQGLNKQGIPVFKEMAAEYGLADTGDGVMAAFFDYDNDGDLDMYLVKTMEPSAATRQFTNVANDGKSPSTDKLYRNDWSDSLHHPVFTDVSAQAGIKEEGFGLGISIADINGDGWKDIYVTNDFNGSDQLYINNGDGKFTNKIHDYFKHTSYNAMGNDIADLNNDALPDVIALDMNAEDNYRKKMNMNGNDYNGYYNLYNYKYEPQFVRNTLQLNQGNIVRDGELKAEPVFSEIGNYSGIAATDWSWSVLCADFDNDGNKDIAITNGYPKDITDHDYVSFLYETTRQGYALPNGGVNQVAGKKQLTDPIPKIKIRNYMFKNMGDMKFKDVGENWGITTPTFSNGAVYVDLDNDGDLDYVVNNVNDRASVYENTTITKNGSNHAANYLRVRFNGDTRNRSGIGATATLYYKGGKQYVENSPYRGYLSTTEAVAHFGLGTCSRIDSLVINWPGKGHLQQVIKNVKANQLLTVNIANAAMKMPGKAVEKVKPLFADQSKFSGVDIQHNDQDFFEFGTQRLIPHKFSQYGPCLAAGDINGDGLDDVFVGGTSKTPGYFLIQKPGGKFYRQDLPNTGKVGQLSENMACLLFDADNDGDLDLLVTCGSFDNHNNQNLFADKLYLNDGKGHFTLSNVQLPYNPTYKFCIKGADFNHDGKIDLFIGSRGIPGKYPLAGGNIILRNDSQNGVIKFTDVTDEVAPGLRNVGLVSDALWTDTNNDGWLDLFVVGEWMSPTIYQNNGGKFKNVSLSNGLQQASGWWTSIASGDFNNDGKTDYVLGNLGENSFYKASEQYPVTVYAKDFDENGSIDPVITTWLPGKKNADGSNGPVKEFTEQNRDDIIGQLPGFKKRFASYASFADADIHTILDGPLMDDALIKKASNLSSCVLMNKGNNSFTMVQLPPQAQYAPIYGIVCDDFNGDGSEDILLTGNDHGPEVSLGPYDAFNGLLLAGNGRGGFTPLSIQQSGVYIPGDGKSLVKLRSGKDKYSIAASQNKGKLQYYTLNNDGSVLNLSANDASIFFNYKNGSSRKEEIHYGSSALSQSARFCLVGKNVSSVTIVDFKGKSRKVML